MGDDEGMDAKFLFFGAGRIGRRWIKRFKDWGMAPDGIIDNNKDLCGHLCENIRIYSPDILKTIRFETIFITCKDGQDIYRQLSELGIDKEKIVLGGHDILNHLLYHATCGVASAGFTAGPRNEHIEKKVLFDLQNGMVLGGVESWSYDLAKELKAKGYQGVYLTIDRVPPVIVDDTYPVHVLKYREMKSDKDRMDGYVKEIVENLPCTVVCNFPQYTFWAACIAKRSYPDQVRVIAVQHNDDRIYYEAYVLWQRYIDRYVTISSQMEKKLALSGIGKDHVCHLEWQIPCKERMDRTWSRKGMPLRIGYAGRMTVEQKRTDLFPALAEKLREKSIDFRFEIAGMGDHSGMLDQRIQEEGLQECVVPLGYIERKDIPAFWKRQDIMVSCSEWEGHSISQSEAMAEGVVPVITDVSGARDDVTDGHNGFVVDIGDLDAMADRIACLYHDRGMLERMGKNAHDTIHDRMKGSDQAAFWDDLLKKVWLP